MSLTLFKQNKIEVSNKNHINLMDLIKFTNNLENETEIRNYAKPYYEYNGRGYIEIDTAIKIMQKFRTDECEEILVEYEELSLEEEAIDFGKSIFKFAQKEFAYLEVNGKIWFKGYEIGKFLGYTKPDKAIREHVPENKKSKLGDILNSIDSIGLKSNPPKSGGLELQGNSKNIIYINLAGLNRLIMKSHMKEAERFQDFITDVVIPKIQQYGTFSMKGINQINYDTSVYSYLHNAINISDYIGYNLVYLIVIGMYKSGWLIKYGLTSQIDERFKKHQATYGEKIKLIGLVKTDNNRKVESLFKALIQHRKLDDQAKDLKFNSKSQTELFITNENFTVIDALENFNKIAKDNQSNVIKDKDDELKELKFNNILLIEQEKTKQKQAEAEKEFNEKEKIIEERKKIEAEIELIKLQNKNKENSTKKREKDIYLIFLKENTIESTTHIKTSELYKYFKEWFTLNNPHTIIPNNREFVDCIKKHKHVEHIRVGKSTGYGIKNLKIQNNGEV